MTEIPDKINQGGIQHASQTLFHVLRYPRRPSNISINNG